MIAYHFTNGYKLRDGQPLVVGQTYRYEGKVVMCRSGLHASKHVYDALRYAPGAILSRVECLDIVEQQADKLVCRERTVIATIDATDLLREFARWCALQVIHLWDAPEVVVRYLKTGGESIRKAASSAASDASSSAVWYASRSAVWYASSSAVWSAVWYASSSAVWCAARSAAKSAASDAADAVMLKRQRSKLARMVNAAFREE